MILSSEWGVGVGESVGEGNFQVQPAVSHWTDSLGWVVGVSSFAMSGK